MLADVPVEAIRANVADLLSKAAEGGTLGTTLTQLIQEGAKEKSPTPPLNAHLEAMQADSPKPLEAIRGNLAETLSKAAEGGTFETTLIGVIQEGAKEKSPMPPLQTQQEAMQVDRANPLEAIRANLAEALSKAAEAGTLERNLIGVIQGTANDELLPSPHAHQEAMQVNVPMGATRANLAEALPKATEAGTSEGELKGVTQGAANDESPPLSHFQQGAMQADAPIQAFRANLAKSLSKATEAGTLETNLIEMANDESPTPLLADGSLDGIRANLAEVLSKAAEAGTLETTLIGVVKDMANDGSLSAGPHCNASASEPPVPAPSPKEKADSGPTSAVHVASNVAAVPQAESAAPKLAPKGPPPLLVNTASSPSQEVNAVLEPIEAQAVTATKGISYLDPSEVEQLRGRLRCALSKAALAGSLPSMLSEAEAIVEQRDQFDQSLTKNAASTQICNDVNEMEALRTETFDLKTRTEHLESLVTTLINDNDSLRKVIASKLG
jgi:hypothetical protein